MRKLADPSYARKFAGVSSVDDKRPICAIMAMLGAAIGSTTTDTAEEVARLRDEVIELKGLMHRLFGRDGNIWRKILWHFLMNALKP